MRADLHVHTYHSGYAKHLRVLHARDCYSPPEAVYRAAKARGMDLVCFTDHDSIDGCLEFRDAHPDAPDFLVGEEIECHVPDAPGLRVHLGAIGMTERLHRDIQPLRDNVFDVAARLTSAGVFFSVNHLFLLFADEMPVERYVRDLLAAAPGLEVHNGSALAAHNDLVAALATAPGWTGRPLTATGGSDAHTLRYVGTAYTETPATTRDGFLADLHAGRTRTGGAHGSRGRMTAEIYGVIFSSWRALLGLERHDLSPGRRAAAGIVSALLTPAQILPAVIAIRMKAAEARRVRRYQHLLDGTLAWATVPAAPSPAGRL